MITKNIVKIQQNLELSNFHENYSFFYANSFAQDRKENSWNEQFDQQQQQSPRGREGDFDGELANEWATDSESKVEWGGRDEQELGNSQGYGEPQPAANEWGEPEQRREDPPYKASTS